MSPSSFRLRSHGSIDSAQVKRIVLLLLGAFAVIGWIYLLFMSDVLTLQGIVLEEGTGLDPITAKGLVLQDLDKRSVWRPWPARHIFFLDTGKLAEQLKEQWFAEDVQISHKPWQRILRLKVQERTNRLVVHSKQQFLWVDMRGFVTQELSLPERQIILERLQGRRQSNPTDPMIINTDLQELVISGYRVADPTVIRGWLEIDAFMKSHQLLYRSLDITDGQAPSQASLSLSNGIPSYIDTQENVLGQINALAKYLEYVQEHKKDGSLKPTEYIDVRIPGRVYVK